MNSLNTISFGVIFISLSENESPSNKKRHSGAFPAVSHQQIQSRCLVTSMLMLKISDQLIYYILFSVWFY